MRTLLSPKDLAVAIGVSESSLKRWADDGRIAVDRTMGGHRRIALTEAVRFIRESKINIVRPDILGLPVPSKARLASRSEQGFDDAVHQALREGDAPGLRAIIFDMYVTGSSAAEICDGPLARGMHKMGECWLREKTGIFLEHRATTVCIETINLLRTLIPRSAPEAPIALGGGPSADPYLIPSKMAAMVLQDAGYAAVNLGPDTPIDAFIDGIEHYQPRLVWLSISGKTGSVFPRQELTRLIEKVGEMNALLVVGGQSIKRSELPMHPALRYGASMADLSEYGKSMLEPPVLEHQISQ